MLLNPKYKHYQCEYWHEHFEISASKSISKTDWIRIFEQVKPNQSKDNYQIGLHKNIIYPSKISIEQTSSQKKAANDKLLLFLVKV
jgi:predicted RNase H-like nuclease